MRAKIFVALATILLSSSAFPAEGEDQPLVQIDENSWIVFYDVPSRRFRDIRDSFVRRRFDMAARDLFASATYLRIEADRALPIIAERLNEVATRMTWVSENISDPSVTVGELDPLFARAHWLLAQHYLDHAKRSRDSEQHRNAGRYLWATTHHLERAVLWSNGRISRDLVKALDDLRDMASRLQDNERAARAYREKPIVRAEKVLRELGIDLDRRVLLPQQ